MYHLFSSRAPVCSIGCRGPSDHVDICLLLRLHNNRSLWKGFLCSPERVIILNNTLQVVENPMRKPLGVLCNRSTGTEYSPEVPRCTLRPFPMEGSDREPRKWT